MNTIPVTFAVSETAEMSLALHARREITCRRFERGIRNRLTPMAAEFLGDGIYVRHTGASFPNVFFYQMRVRKSQIRITLLEACSHLDMKEMKHPLLKYADTALAVAAEFNVFAKAAKAARDTPPSP